MRVIMIWLSPHTSQFCLLSCSCHVNRNTRWMELQAKKKKNKNTSKINSTIHRQNLAHYLFLSIEFYWNTVTPIHICISYGCFHINVPNCVVVLNYMACKKNLYSFKTLYSLTFQRKFVNLALEHVEEFLFLHIFLNPKTNRMIYQGIKEKILKFLFIIHCPVRKRKETKFY